MPNSYVNDDGKPDVNKSNAVNDNNGAVVVRFERVTLRDTFTPTAYLAAGFG